MDVLIKLSYDDTVSLNACGSESDDIYVSGQEYRWVDWKTYKQFKKRTHLKAIVGRVSDGGGQVKVPLEMTRILDGFMLNFVAQNGVELFSSTKIDIKGFKNKEQQKTTACGPSPTIIPYLYQKQRNCNNIPQDLTQVTVCIIELDDFELRLPPIPQRTTAGMPVIPNFPTNQPTNRPTFPMDQLPPITILPMNPQITQPLTWNITPQEKRSFSRANAQVPNITKPILMIPDAITNLVSLTLKGAHIYYGGPVEGRIFSQLDPNILTRFVNLEELTLTGFVMSGNTNFLHSFPRLTSLCLNVEIRRGNLPLPLVHEIKNISVIPNFWRREELEQQTQLKRLFWDHRHNFLVDLRSLPLLEYYSDKYFDESHLESTATAYSYEYISSTNKRTLLQFARANPLVSEITANKMIIYQKPTPDDDEPPSEKLVSDNEKEEDTEEDEDSDDEYY